MKISKILITKKTNWIIEERNVCEFTFHMRCSTFWMTINGVIIRVYRLIFVVNGTIRTFATVNFF